MEPYKKIPESWFLTTFGLAFSLAIICTGIGFGPGFSFPYWAILAAFLTGFVLVIPLAIFIATTKQVSSSFALHQIFVLICRECSKPHTDSSLIACILSFQMIPISVAFGLIGGYLFPKKPFENMVYINHAFQIATNTVQFTSFLKLGHFVKIRPKVMYIVMVNSYTSYLIIANFNASLVLRGIRG